MVKLKKRMRILKLLCIGMCCFSFFACTPMSEKEGVITPEEESVKVQYHLTDGQAQLVGHIKNMKSALDERRYLSEESSRIEAELEKQIKRTYYVEADGVPLFEVEGGAVVRTLTRKDQLLLSAEDSEEINAEYALVVKVNGEDAKGYIARKRMKKSPIDFIVKVYEGVEYNPIQKSPDFEDNPRIKAKAIYVTQSNFAGQKLNDMIKIANETEINAFVIDVKDDYGNILFHSKAADEVVPEANGKSGVKDFEAKMALLKENNIYTIGRIVTFRSPRYASRYPERAIAYLAGGGLYKQGDGLPWASAYDEALWAYNVAICKEAAVLGFNEIQFDYVRFPATGSKLDKTLDFKNVNDLSKPVAIQRFLLYAREELKPYSIYITADIFGWAATQLSDVEIGQHWEAVSNGVDYIAPMMYPSHYGPNNFGLVVPDARPYATILASGKDAINRNSNLYTPAIVRPWIQDFTATWVKGHISYGPIELREQIKALEEIGIDEFMIWNPRNNYSVMGLKKEEKR